MDKGEGGGDQMEEFHRSEAISAVADVGIFAEEEDDEDYEDLYNDVNVGEGFLQSVRKNEDLAFQNQGNNDSSNINDVNKVEKKADLPAVAQNLGATATVPGESSGVGAGRVSGYETQGFRATDIKGPAGGSSGGLRVELGGGQNSGLSKVNDFEERTGSSVIANSNSNINNSNHSVSLQANVVPMQPQQLQSYGGGVVNVHDEGVVRNVNGGGNVSGNGGGGGGTVLFVGDLHWWTTDAELEAELCKYGAVKEVKFFDEKASGKSKGYCQVEFFDPGAASACKEGMNGYVFNGRPCVVAFASPFTVKKMGEAQVHRNQQIGGQAAGGQARRGANDGGGKSGGVGGAAGGGGANIATGGNYQGGDGNRGRGNWGRGNGPGMGNRGPLGPMRNRPGGMGGRGIMGSAGNGFGQGMGAVPPLMHPNMMGQGFDPAFGGPMGRMAGYGGFPGGPAPPFGGILSSFPPVGMPGVAPHVNPAFFGRGMPMSGMGMMPTGGVDGPNMGMWSDPNMGGWTGEENGGGRVGESSYGEEAASDHQYGEVSHDRGGWQNSMKEKDRAGSSDRRYRDDREAGYDRDVPKEKDVGGPDHDWPERRHRDDRDGRDRERERDRDRERSRDRDRERERDRDRDRDRDRHREDRDKYADHHRYRDRETEHDDEWDRGRSSRTHSKSRLPQEDDHHSRSRDADYGKRRRLTSE